MILWVLPVLTYVADNLVLLLFFDFFLDRNRRFKGIRGAISVISFVVMLQALYSYTMPGIFAVNIIFYHITQIAAAFLFYRGTWLQKLFVVIVSQSFVYGLDGFIGGIIAYTMGKNSMQIRATVLGLHIPFIGALATLLIALAVKAALSKKYGGQKTNINKLNDWFTLLAIPVVSFIAVLSLGVYMRNVATISIPLVLATLSPVIKCLLLIVSVERTISREQANTRLALVTQQQNVLEESLQRQVRIYQAQSSDMHDYSNNIRHIALLLEEQQTDEAKAFAKTLSVDLYATKLKVYAHNLTVDAVLTEKIAFAGEHGIEMEITCSDLHNLPMQPRDIVSVLSNILDNAIEACLKLLSSKRQVRVKLEYEDELFVFSVINPVERQIDVEKPLETTKPEPHLHGIGLKSAALSLAKYGGTGTLFCIDKEFQYTAVVDFKHQPTAVSNARTSM